MSEERQCRNSILMMCRHYPDLGISDTSPVENLLHPIRIVISHPGMRNFCAYSSDFILQGICWWHHKMLAFFSGYCAKINGGGMKLLKFILRNTDCWLTWQNDLVTFWKPGEKILQNAIWLKELIIISCRSQFRQKHSMSHSFVFSLTWVVLNSRLRQLEWLTLFLLLLLLLLVKRGQLLKSLDSVVLRKKSWTWSETRNYRNQEPITPVEIVVLAAMVLSQNLNHSPT